jgi:hypothetical protein
MNSSARGWAGMIMPASPFGNRWVDNVSKLFIVGTPNASIPDVDWTLTIDGYHDQVLNYDDIIHLTRSELYGTLGDGSNPGYYEGYELKTLVEEYVGEWTNYTVSLRSNTGYTKTLSKAQVDSKNIILAYMNRSFYSFANEGYVYRSVSLNDTDLMSDVWNLTKVTINPLDMPGNWTFQIVNGSNSDEVLAS